MSSVRRVVASIVVFAFLAVVARLVVPFSPADKRVFVPPDRYLDATLATFLVADGVDKLFHDPRHFYDTAILYPDRTQLRSTEPFLGFAILALPFKAVLHPGDADVFEMLRWTMVFASLAYAYWLFKAAGVDTVTSAAGAAVCLCGPNLLIGISRLQILSIPLLLPVLYHGLMVWAGRRPRAGHSLALFVWLALYPLCGMVNAAVGVVAAVLLLPLCLKACVELWRDHRLPALALPIAAALLVDAVALAPWLVDRGDMRVYSSPAFLAIKRWTPTFVPLRAVQIPPFIEAVIGFSVATPLALLSALIVARRVGAWSRRAPQLSGSAPLAHGHVWIVPVLAAVMAVLAAYGINRDEVRWLGVGFDVACVLALLAYWRAQLRLPPPGPRGDLARPVALIGAGLGVFLCLVSFGPVYVSNRHPLASGITTALLEVVPPMKSVREFDRVWIFGILFTSIYAIVTIGRPLREQPAMIRGSAAAVLLAAAGATLYSRPLVASPPIEAPVDLVALAARSPRKGAIYVHPYMKWNSRSGVLMIAIAKELKRPIVNGYLGIIPPWFSYATEVLHRYPDPEALWLLRKWKVETVLSLVGDVQLEQLSAPFQPGDVAVREVEEAPELPHPSQPRTTSAGQMRVDAAWAPLDRERVPVSRVVAPAGFRVAAVEIHFQPTPGAPVPASVDVYAIDDTRRVRLNDGQSGEWLKSLAADALVRRQSPIATVTLVRPAAGELEIECRNSADPPIKRIVLIGDRID
jgi:hypothetical protein